MEPKTYDLVIIGSGPAGEKGATQAAYFGKSVALIEKEPWLGGASANTGTLPSKTLRETALFFGRGRNLGRSEIAGSKPIDFGVVEESRPTDDVIRNFAGGDRPKMSG